VLFGVGRLVGPDLTGSNRSDLDYLLQAIVDPNAVIPNEYRASNLETLDGRVLTGILREQDDRAVTLLTADETVVMPRNEIVELQESSLSMMPEGLLDHLPDQELRDLIYYLTRPGQAPLFATPDTLGPIFNERDLAGWYGNPDVWRAQAGQILGRPAGASAGDEVLVHDVLFSDFRLVLQARLASGSGGIQFRSRPHGDMDLHGYQLELGNARWGRLEETRGRGTLHDPAGDLEVEAGDWVICEIVAVGSRVLAAINGRQVVDLDDPRGVTAGVLGLRLTAGDAAEVRFRDFRVELDPEPVLVTVAAGAGRR
jgi:putative heme-binding domain-containing protein